MPLAVLRMRKLSSILFALSTLIITLGASLGTAQQASSIQSARPADESRSRSHAAAVGRTLVQLQEATQPIRIHTEYQGLDAVSNTSQALLLKLLVSEATKVIQRHLSVSGPTAPTLLAPPLCTSGYAYKCLSWYPDFQSPIRSVKSCGLSSINPEHVLLSNTPACASNDSRQNQAPCTSAAGGLGAATDFYLYVSTYPVSCSSGAASSALPCLFDPGTNRPLMGSINVCPEFLARADPHNLLGVILHEMVHTLGFMGSMFQSFVDPQGNVLPQEQVLRSTVVGGRTVQQVVTPRVVQEVRAHFNCPRLQGAQLEALGGGSSAGSHWEYTLFQGEVMVASTAFSAQGDSPRLTRLTLALLEDSGWYRSNLSGAAPLTWGRDAGCDFLELSCSEYSQRYPDNPYFCQLPNNSSADQQQTPSNASASASAGAGAARGFSCTPSLKSQGTCSSNSFLDPGCGLLVSRSATQSCLNASLQYGDAEVFGWFNGASSRCIQASYQLVATARGSVYTFPGGGAAVQRDAVCFPMHCEAGELFVDVQGRPLACRAGSVLDLGQLLPGLFRGGSLGPCPDNAAACATLACPGCSAGGDCLAGQCFCKLGFGGEGCALDAVTGEQLVGYTMLIPPQAPAPSAAPIGTLGVAVIATCSLLGLLAILGAVYILVTYRKAPVMKPGAVQPLGGSPESKADMTQTQPPVRMVPFNGC